MLKIAQVLVATLLPLLSAFAFAGAAEDANAALELLRDKQSQMPAKKHGCMPL